jgi:hypothetical protein
MLYAYLINAISSRDGHIAYQEMGWLRTFN